MNIPPLKIPLVKQHPESDDCLRCCAQMVFSYFEDSITKKGIWKKLHVYKKGSGLYGAYFEDLGKVAITRGYEVAIAHYDWQWWNKEVVESLSKGKDALFTSLEKLWQDKAKWSDKRCISKEVNYIKMGGEYRFEISRLDIIDNYLREGVPVILSVRAEDLYHDPKEDYAHAILVVGKNEDEYLLKDPYLGLEKISAEQLYYCWARNGGWMMVVEKNR